MRNNPARPLDAFLSSDGAAGRLLAHASLLQKLARIFADLAPEHLVHTSRVANFKSGTVIIHADNGAVAARLRQMAPTLTGEFCKRGIECSEVRIKVQASPAHDTHPAHVQRPLSHNTCSRLHELAESLPARSPLREALAHLVARAAKAE